MYEGCWLKICWFSVFRFVKDLLQLSEWQHFLKKIFTGDETCIYGYDVETKWHLSLWKSPDLLHPKNRDKWKQWWLFSIVTLFIMILFQLARWLIRYYSLEVLMHMKDVVWSKHTEISTAGTWYLHHDSAPAHRLFVDSRVLDKASDSCPSTTYIFTWCIPGKFPVHHTKNDYETKVSNGREHHYKNR